MRFLSLLFLLAALPLALSPAWAQDVDDASAAVPMAGMPGLDAKAEKAAPESPTGFYAALNIGGFGANRLGALDLDNGMQIGLAGGYDWGLLRWEGEYAYRNADLPLPSDRVVFIPFHGFFLVAQDLDIHAFMTNLWLDIPIKGRLGAYGGGGVGLAVVRDSVVDDTVLSYQLGAGLGYALNRRLRADIGYRFFRTQSLDPIADSLVTHGGTLSLRYSF
ncbi:MAG: outer membrane protein [Pseudomonadota bacterium]